MSEQDIRWHQRFANYEKAFSQLNRALELAEERELSELERQGLIQAFEYTHELAWKTLKDFLEQRGAGEMYGSKDVTREAFNLGIIENGEVWMDMINSRNQTFHTYNEEVAEEIIKAVIDNYATEFRNLKNKLDSSKQGKK